MSDKSVDHRLCGQALVELLEAYGVDTVFGIPGVHTQEIYRGLAESGIRHVLPRHEQGAGFMAAGYARASGKPGVCVLITGPGVTNAATAIGQGYADSLPMLIVSSENERDTLGKGYGELHEISDQAAVTRPLTGFNAVAQDVDGIPALFAAAFESFQTGRPRPAHIAVPIDLLASRTRGPWTPAAAAAARKPDEASIAAAAERVSTADRPVICVGGGAVGAASQVLTLAERLDAPVLSTHAGKGIVPSTHPLNAGSSLHLGGGQSLLADADVVIAIGTELAWTDSFVERLPITGDVVRVDVDETRFDDRYPATVGVEGDAAQACDAMLRVLGHGPSNRGGGQARVQEASLANTARRTELEVKHGHVLSAVRNALPDNAIVSVDSTQITYTGQFDFPVDSPRQWMYGAGFCTLGGALPEGIGAALACPDSPVMVIAGDGGFMFSMPELATAVELGLSLPILVWNNDGLAQIKDGMVSRGFNPTGVTTRNPDFGALAAAFGCRSARPKDAHALEAAITDALIAGVPTLIEVHEGDPWLA
jgi:5-guanidino-2-oxopentanoate decarboxylase